MKRFIRLLLIMAIFGVNYACGQKTASSSVVSVSPAEFLTDIRDGGHDGAYVLDVRTPQEYAEGHVDGAHNLDWLNPSAFRAGLSALPKDRTIYVYCRSGARSAKAAEFLAERGYKVVNLAGGFADLSALSRR